MSDSGKDNSDSDEQKRRNAADAKLFITEAEHNDDSGRKSCNIPTTAKYEAVDHPAHYGGADDPYEAVKVIEAWDLNFNLGNCVKYINRRMRKPKTDALEDLKKAAWYLNREIENMRKRFNDG